MAYQSLYRKYRPATMDEVVGQKHIVDVLVNSIKKDKISHAYLLCGPRGTGKTSIAKLFAGAVNCTDPDKTICGVCDNCKAVQLNNHPDLVEIDAASNNGVDEIRSLIERVKYTPILGKYKVYVIDEVHMLTQGAFNALLKTLEEPPSHVVFILATTEIHKVLPTIISRCQRFDFTRIPDEGIAKRLNHILELEKVQSEPGVTQLIASLSGGGLRNALTILEQAIVLADEKITLAQIYEANGIITAEDKIKLFQSFINQDMNALLEIIHAFSAQSVHYERLVMDLVSGLKDSIVYTHTKDMRFADQNVIEFITFLDVNYRPNDRIKIIDVLLEYVEKMRFSQNPEVYFEVALIDIFNSQGGAPDTVHETPAVTSVQPLVKKIEPQTEVKPVYEAKPETTAVIPETMNVQEEGPESFEIEDEAGEDIIETIPETMASPTILDNDMIVRLMVTADKDLRMVDEEKFEKISMYRNNPQWARPARLLNGGKVVLSSSFFVVVAMSNDIEVRELAEERNRMELNKFSEVLFDTPKVMLSTSNRQFKEAIDAFVRLNKDQTLPQPVLEHELVVAQSEEITEIKDESLESVLDLFGDTVTIID
ncbi:DNA polymerase III subunit gamma/tau [Erysipelothrix sp. HDW6C]|uniref:DNA polymerase III subunit gamma/tau n=1 Tax=Erysipelothrix sp. HDW6C TaxID=2714930 RepID=UPI0014086C53|nr:DNA polymerase III subunit gamma/tau [Erysipelothrix sp. HDW6C]QIK69090.1 DNA polymerase III subunit gamma/tau [Erysipelothrix sp. HDW6C]